jgi:phosphate:Na+ symporter
MTDAAALNPWQVAIGLAGGLALFLYGLDKIAEGLRAAAGESMRRLLARLTTNRFLGVLTGATATAILQSSTLTTVLVVGFISAGLMTLPQSVGVILGANVGTTVTAQVVAFKVTEFALLLVALGVGLPALLRQDAARRAGALLLGFGLLFLSIDLMTDATLPLRESERFLALMRRLEHPLAGILAGTLAAAVLQSSSATTGIVITFASQGLVTLEAGIALALGANIGTCVTALVAGLGKPVDARQAAMVHLLVNVIGVALWVGFIEQLAWLARAVSPAAVELQGVARVAAEAPRQIANAHTIFNVATTAVLVWFTGPLATLATRLVRERRRPEELPPPAAPRYLDEAAISTPAVALDLIRREIVHNGQLVLNMMAHAPRALLQGTSRDLEELHALDEQVDNLHVAILSYGRKLSLRELGDRESRRLTELLTAATYVENAGDLIATNLVRQATHRVDWRVTFPPVVVRAVTDLFDTATEAFQEAVTALEATDPNLAAVVDGSKERLRLRMTAAIDALGAAFRAGTAGSQEVFRIGVDMVGVIQGIHRLARRLAGVVAGEDGNPPASAAGQ